MTRALLAWMAFAAGSIFVIVDIVRLTITGLFLLGVALIVLALIESGVFKRDFWFGDAEYDAECARIDRELDEAERAHRFQMSAGGAQPPDAALPDAAAPSADPRR